MNDQSYGDAFVFTVMILAVVLFFARGDRMSMAPDTGAHWLNPKWHYVRTADDSPEKFRARMERYKRLVQETDEAEFNAARAQVWDRR